MARSQFEKARARKDKGRFAKLPRAAMQSPAVATLNNLPFRVLTIAAAECTGFNNGNINLVRANLKQYGVHRSGAVQTAIDELIERGLLVKTRQGGLGSCSLYAVPWFELTKDPKAIRKLDHPLPRLPDMRFMAWQKQNAGAPKVPDWNCGSSFDDGPPQAAPPERSRDSSFSTSPRNLGGAPSKTLPGGEGETGGRGEVSNG